MRVIFFLLWLTLSWQSYGKELSSSVISIAVGPDHHLMLNNDYKFYTASWHFLTDALTNQNIIVAAHPMPWARAKAKVLSGDLDGLFLAANFKGREQWAELSEPLGYDYFGHFTKVTPASTKEIIGVVRVGKHDSVHQDLADSSYIEVATAQIGLTLLAQNKITKFTMSQEYGNYLLANELQEHRSLIHFDINNAEKRSSHLAVSKQHKDKQKLLNVINKAISSGIEQGTYQHYMEKYNVPCTHRLTC